MKTRVLALGLLPFGLVASCDGNTPVQGAAVEAGTKDGSTVRVDAGPPPGLDPSVPRPAPPPLGDIGNIVRDGGEIVFSGGELTTGAALPAESASVSAFRCLEGMHQSCINMRQYWPTPKPGEMQVKNWEFFDMPGVVSRGKTIYRTQGLFSIAGPAGVEYRLIDHFNGPQWRTGYALDGEPLTSWLDTWSLRYDDDTVVEYKDDANINTTFLKPQVPGLAFARSVYDQGHELRWGKRLVGGVDNLSQTYTWTTKFPTSSLSNEETSRSFADNTFGLVEVRNNVIVAGVRYDNVAIVRVSQRGCEPNTMCNPVDAESGDWIVDYFYMAPTVGMIARFQYVPKTLDGGAWVTAGGLSFVLNLVEIVTDLCTKTAPAPQYDWLLAFSDGSLTTSAPAPSCP
jgi:hypothetical protein